MGCNSPAAICKYVRSFAPFRQVASLTLRDRKQQSAFLKDLATLRNPQSPYTFLSYLASFTPSRLVSFISRETFTPSRREFTDYLEWAARKVQGELEGQEGETAYGEEVLSVDGVLEEGGSDVQLLKVTSRDVKTGSLRHRLARNLVLSTGGSPRIPRCLSTPEIQATCRVVHTSAFLDRISSLLSTVVSPLPSSRPLRLAVIGSGQVLSLILAPLMSWTHSFLISPPQKPSSPSAPIFPLTCHPPSTTARRSASSSEGQHFDQRKTRRSPTRCLILE